MVNDKGYNQKLKDAAVRKLVWGKLHKNIVMDGDTMTDMRKHKVLSPEVDYTHWKEKFKSIFFLSGFSFMNIHYSQDSRGRGEGISLTPLYHFHPHHRHLDINQAITAESSPLHIASSQTQTRNLWFPSEVTNL